MPILRLTTGVCIHVLHLPGTQMLSFHRCLKGGGEGKRQKGGQRLWMRCSGVPWQKLTTCPCSSLRCCGPVQILCRGAERAASFGYWAASSVTHHLKIPPFPDKLWWENLFYSSPLLEKHEKIIKLNYLSLKKKKKRKKIIPLLAFQMKIAWTLSINLNWCFIWSVLCCDK